MVSKSLTHIFMIMRDKSLQRKNMYQIEEGYGDREALVVHDRGSICSRLPEWTNMAEEVRYNITTLEHKTKKLHTLQSNLVRRPSLEDNNPEELQLAALTNEITKLLERCRLLTLQLSRATASGREEHLRDSVARALMLALADLNTAYSASCAAYTQSMQSLKQTSNFTNSTTVTFDEKDSHADAGPGWSEDQLMFLSSNQSAVIAGRERAVQDILRSTLHLNQLFRDVAYLVHEQGTLVDRIDCNIEVASVKVKEGSQQLRKAQQHQKKNRNVLCILGLATAIVVLLLLLVFVKS